MILVPAAFFTTIDKSTVNNETASTSDEDEAAPCLILDVFYNHGQQVRSCNVSSQDLTKYFQAKRHFMGCPTSQNYYFTVTHRYNITIKLTITLETRMAFLLQLFPRTCEVVIERIYNH